MVNREQFQSELDSIFKVVQELGLSFVDVKSGDLHRLVGGYPGDDHRMPICCDVMHDNIWEADTVLEEPPKGKGATVIIRYQLPR